MLGYLASLGVTDLLFRALHRGSTPWIGLDWTVAFFLFVILVAVGEDYNIFLMARVIEEEREHGTIEGTRLAVAHTGGIISSCGLIMAGTFGSMLTGQPDLAARAWFCARPGRLARHLPGAADPGARHSSSCSSESKHARLRATHKRPLISPARTSILKPQASSVAGTVARQQVQAHAVCRSRKNG